MTDPSWSSATGDTATATPIPVDESTPPSGSVSQAGCGICDPMNDSQLASLICETRQQIKYYETVLALRDADIALLTKGIREAESLTYRLLDKLIAWDKAYQLYLKGLGPNPEKTLGSRDKYYTPWSEAARQEQHLRTVLAGIIKEREAAVATLDALRKYLAGLERDLFELCHDQPVTKR